MINLLCHNIEYCHRHSVTKSMGLTLHGVPRGQSTNPPSSSPGGPQTTPSKGPPAAFRYKRVNLDNNKNKLT